MRKSIALLLIINFLLLSITILSTPLCVSNYSSIPDCSNMKKEVEKYSETGVRGQEGSAFIFQDNINDVWLVDYKSVKYDENCWYDIKSISTEIMADVLFLNMTMNDNVQDDEEIYYKMRAGDVEVVLFLGRGEVIYDESTEERVQYKNNLISAEINISKLTYSTFSIYGSVYREDYNPTFGDYIITDEITGEDTTQKNSLVLHFDDDLDDVSIKYTISEYVESLPEVDIKETRLWDEDSRIKLKIEFVDQIQSSNGYRYIIEIGQSIFKFISGESSVSYNGYEGGNVDLKINGAIMELNFDKTLIENLNSFTVTAEFEPTPQTNYKDEDTIEIPKHLYLAEETLNLEVIMFDNAQLIMRLNGTISPANSEVLRRAMDEHGNGNSDGIVDESESASYISELKEHYTSVDFFDFFPSLDSKPGQQTVSVEFLWKNTLGNVSFEAPIEHIIVSKWSFQDLAKNQNQHEIMFQFLPYVVQMGIGQNYIFNFIYQNVKFNFTEEFKYWEIVPNTIFPTDMNEYYISEIEQFEFGLMEYELFVNHIGPNSKFGFNIQYNQSAAEEDKKSSEDEEANGSGFLPGFEACALIIPIIMIIIYKKTNYHL